MTGQELSFNAKSEKRRRCSPLAVSANGQPSCKWISIPGRTVDIGGRKLYLNCAGKGSPTVVLVAGGDAFSIDWALVQPKVAEKYAGLLSMIGQGWDGVTRAPQTKLSSNPSPISMRCCMPPKKSRRSRWLARRLEEFSSSSFTGRFPTEVAGLVFTNSSNQVGMKVKKTKLDSCNA